MKILIVSATSLEIEPTLNYLGKGQNISNNLTRYKSRGWQVDVLLTGVGMVSTTYWMTQVSKNRKYDAFINVGICGSFNHNLKLGDVINVLEDSFPEKGAESGEYFLSLIDLKLLEQDEYPFTNGKLINNTRLDSKLIDSLPSAKAVTVNTVHGNLESIRKFLMRNDADIESMEGAAFFYVAFLAGTPCLQLRAVSNYVEPRDTSRWQIPLAIQNLNNALIELLQE
ncbi:MAG: futalosine hydrolase [Bacteroidales bacterium]|nr:futalosine hydrolase [Bacteroidales bacterium]